MTTEDVFLHAIERGLSIKAACSEAGIGWVRGKRILDGNQRVKDIWMYRNPIHYGWDYVFIKWIRDGKGFDLACEVSGVSRERGEMLLRMAPDLKGVRV